MKPENRYLLLLLGIPLLLFATECKKHHSNPYSDNGLPPATQTGANIFACRVNGKVWIAKKNIYDMGGGLNKDTLSAYGAVTSNTGFEDIEIDLIGIDIRTSSIYKLSDPLKTYVLYTTNKSCFSETGGYGVGRAKSIDGELTLTRVDTVNKIISGTFWVTVPTAYCDTLYITDGRFDIHYY